MKRPRCNASPIRAAAEGLLDVAYTSVDSPFGPLLLAATPRGLVRVRLPGRGSRRGARRAGGPQVSPRVLEAPARLDEPRRELDLYFEGRLRDFELPLDWQLTDGFRGRVQRAIAEIPLRRDPQLRRDGRPGRQPAAPRGANPIPIVVLPPCLGADRPLPLSTAALPVEGALLELGGVL